MCKSHELNSSSATPPANNPKVQRRFEVMPISLPWHGNTSHSTSTVAPAEARKRSSVDHELYGKERKYTGRNSCALGNIAAAPSCAAAFQARIRRNRYKMTFFPGFLLDGRVGQLLSCQLRGKVKLLWI
jgi:hypothetical protein